MIPTEYIEGKKGNLCSFYCRYWYHHNLFRKCSMRQRMNMIISDILCCSGFICRPF